MKKVANLNKYDQVVNSCFNNNLIFDNILFAHDKTEVKKHVFKLDHNPIQLSSEVSFEETKLFKPMPQIF